MSFDVGLHLTARSHPAAREQQEKPCPRASAPRCVRRRAPPDDVPLEPARCWPAVRCRPALRAGRFIEALTRRGFDLAHADLSLLSNGPSAGSTSPCSWSPASWSSSAPWAGRRPGQPRTTRAPAFIGVFGAGLIGAGLFVADPMGGFPPGAPAGRPAHVTLHGTGHFVTAAIGFLGLLIACALFARHFSRSGERGLARSSALAGVVFLAAFVGVASGSTAAPVVVGFWIGVIVAFTWLTVLCIRLHARCGQCRAR